MTQPIPNENEAHAFLRIGYEQAKEDLDAWGVRLDAFYKPLVEQHLAVNNFTSAKHQLRSMPESCEKVLLFRAILIAEETTNANY